MSETVNGINSAAGEYMPEERSYDNAAMSLQSEFGYRGSIGSVEAEAAELDRTLMESRLANPEAYLLGDIIACDTSSKYRSGVDGDNRYMTVDDFLRFCSDGDEYMKRSHGRRYENLMRQTYDSRIDSEKRPAAPFGVADAYAPDTHKGRRMTVISGESETELAVTGIKRERDNKLAALNRKYIGQETVVTAGTSARHASGVIIAFSLIVVFVMILSMPIGIHIMIQNEKENISELNSEIAAVEKENEQLEIELKLRNEDAGIRELAIGTYGMETLDSSAYTFLRLNAGDTIKVSDEYEASNGLFPQLLKALGLRSGK